MEVDISNKTIVVLVILTVVISVLSTLVVLNEVSNLKTDGINAKEVSASSQSQGQISLTILPKQEPVQANGLVTLEILPAKNNN